MACLKDQQIMNEININYYKIVQNKVHKDHNFLYTLTMNLIMACCNVGGNAGIMFSSLPTVSLSQCGSC